MLARAWRQRREELRVARVERGAARDRVAKAEWLVAHRELQLIRAGAVGSAKYVGHRSRKLDSARKELAKAQRRLRALERAA